MPDSAAQDLDVSRILLDLKLCAEVINTFTGCLDSTEISTRVTNGLVETLGCAFARIWLVAPDRQALELVASAGLYTRLDGSFARVPMGHFKIGKIAQNCIPFLSNCLSEEAWVKDREWAKANNIQGFAGLPLMQADQAIGVLAIFSTAPMNPGLLEVLQMLSFSIAGALASALEHQALMRAAASQRSEGMASSGDAPDDASDALGESLSEQLAAMLGRQKLSMLGTEHRLALPARQLLLQLAKRLADISYRYCRLVYDDEFVGFETMLARKTLTNTADLDTAGSDNSSFRASFEEIAATAQALGGELSVRSDDPQTVISVRLQLPYERVPDSLLEVRSPLSEREHEVMRLMAKGLRDREIADQLYISVRTVKVHAKNRLTKLNVNTRIQAVFEATKKGWLD
ncbi:MAG: LuxR C-terminal-related transcriptional regulator [Phormidesmis sp.]